MKQSKTDLSNSERLATLALWGVPGIGPKMFGDIRSSLHGDLSVVLKESPVRWAGQVKLSLPVRQFLSQIRSLAEVGNRLAEKAKKAGIGIAFPGELAYPENLVGLPEAPPLLFYLGSPNFPRRRVAMVGSRHPDQAFLAKAKRFAFEVAQGGVGIISGAAEGVDRVCHWGALEAGEETWAFLGSGLDELDPPQAKLLPHFLARGGIFYSEFPLGVRASSATFPRRNRLISGAADAVVILRAGPKSGSLYTARYATRQGRPLLALPGDATNEAARGCNDLISSGEARLCGSPADVWAALGVQPGRTVPPSPPGVPMSLDALSERARGAYSLLPRKSCSFDELLGAWQLSSAALTSALCELELLGLVIQHPGKVYERV